VRGEVRTADGGLVAESHALFMRLPKEKVAELERVYLEAGQPDLPAHGSTGSP
jgi:hypothetical protein